MALAVVLKNADFSEYHNRVWEESGMSRPANSFEIGIPMSGEDWVFDNCSCVNVLVGSAFNKSMALEWNL